MSSIYDKTILLVAKRHDEDSVAIIGAYPRAWSDHVDYESWETWKLDQAKTYFDLDYDQYEYREVIVTIPRDKLLAFFEPHEVEPDNIELGDS
jgi:hypothetical protein